VGNEALKRQGGGKSRVTFFGREGVHRGNCGEKRGVKKSRGVPKREELRHIFRGLVNLQKKRRKSPKREIPKNGVN